MPLRKVCTVCYQRYQSFLISGFERLIVIVLSLDVSYGNTSLISNERNFVSIIRRFEML